jgi:HSP20 family protein
MKRSPEWKKNFLLFEKNAEELWQSIFEGEQPLMQHVELLSPPVDIYETSDTLCLEVELPGVEREAIRLWTVQGVLFIEVEKKECPPEAKTPGPVNYLCLERKFGRIRRQIELPKPCHPLKAKARYRNGILTVEFQKISERRGQRQNIPIES